MRFSDRMRELVKDDDFNIDEEFPYEPMPLDELEKEIDRMIYKVLSANKRKGVVLRTLYTSDLNALIKDFNERCPLYDISYDEYGMLKDYSVKKFTGEYNGDEYVNGIKTHSKKDILKESRGRTM